MTPSLRTIGLAALGVLGLATAAIWSDALLPPDLARATALSVVVTDERQDILRVFTAADGRWRLPVNVEQVDGRYLSLLRAYEDHRFEDHPGVDPLALLRAAAQWVTYGHIVSGGSTLTMQTARLLEPRPRGLMAKAVQIVRALQLEARYDKREILALYLTLAPFGGNIEGVRAASLAYFGKEPGHLTLGEAALLVALPQSPEHLRPDRNPEAARRGRDKVLMRLAAAGIVDPREASEAAAETMPQRLAFPFRAPHLAQRLAGKAAPGAKIVTTIDGALQRAIESLARDEQRSLGDAGNIALVVVENDSRSVRAYVGGSDFSAPAGQIDLAQRPRSPGSALKPFIYGMGFDAGIIHPDSLIDDMPTRFGDYAPRDFDREFRGTVTARDALTQSLNVPAVALLDRIGSVRFVANLREAGAGLSFRRLSGTPGLPVALGGVGITLADLTMLYAGIARGGEVRPLAYTADAPAAVHRAMSETAAWYLADILAASPVPEGWTQSAKVRSRLVSFKTGTSYGFRDAWAFGFSAQYTVGVWVGRADGSPRPGQYGRNTAAPLLLKVFDLLPAGEPRYRPPPSDAFVVEGNAALPQTLRHFQRDAGATAATAIGAEAPQILFPPDGVQIDWSRRDNDAGVALRASGGSGKLLWVVNGRPLAAPAFAADTFWRPDGEGFADIAVVDGAGRGAAVRIRVRFDR